MTAANILAEALKDILKKQGEQGNAIVLGIPRGGVITADVVARKLSCKMDIIIPRKLTDPDNKEHAVGAVMEDGTTYFDKNLLINCISPKNTLKQRDYTKWKKSIVERNNIVETHRQWQKIITVILKTGQ